MLGRYYKALIALVGVLATAIGAVAADPDIANALPNGWGAGVVAVGAVLTTVLAVLKRNQMTVDQIDAAIEEGDVTIQDVKGVLNRHGETVV